jgi:hypothetical protein
LGVLPVVRVKIPLPAGNVFWSVSKGKMVKVNPLLGRQPV